LGKANLHAAYLQHLLTMLELQEILKLSLTQVGEILVEVMAILPLRRKDVCHRDNALKDARFMRC